MDTNTVLRLILKKRISIIGYINSILGDYHLAEDVFQDVSLIVVNKAEQLSDEAGFTPWVYKIARFESLNAYRKNKKRPLPLGDDILDLLDESWQEGDDLDEPELVETLKDCVKQLPEKSNKIVFLRYFNDLKGREIAERIGMNLDALYKTLNRIHNGLKKCIKSKVRGGGKTL